ncbi:baseplate multidomain protein megatron [Afipia sp. TerB]
MAALVLSVAGGAAGAAFGPAGALAGRIGGALLGNMLDRSLFSSTQTRTRSVEGPRLADLDVMASTEGAPIARVYGRARLSGQVIWATRLLEVVTTRTETSGGEGGGGGKGFGGGGGGTTTVTTTTTTTYSYFANFAVGLCEGEIGHVGRIWADGKPLDISGLTIRVHRGGEDQLPDDLIVAKEGADNAPAYRGLAYVVFERLPLAGFGNRIPQLSFEIVRPIGALERMTRAVTLIPGTTEFGYDTLATVRVLGPGRSAPENRHVTTARADVMAALDDLQAVCPNLERIAIVTAWFGSDLRAGHCAVRPGVDSAVKVTSGAAWSVAGLTRPGAYVVSTVDGRPAFGGTPSDDSLRHLIAEVKARGIKVTLYPFLAMDIAEGNALPDPWTGAASQPAYPWRGQITCDPAPGAAGSVQGTATAAAQVAQFFSGGGVSGWNYRRMILHYASLAASAGGVDAFLIGSELKALTRVRAEDGSYPAVIALAALAADVKAIIGDSTIVTYGADWTEYGSDVIDGGSEVRFPLDPLWASDAIDAVGIDYYAPLSDWRDEAGHLDSAQATSTHDLDYLRGNLAGGEGYAWYYADDDARAAQSRSAITDGLGKPWIYRAKDLWNWWASPHHERIAGAELENSTAWVPQSKPIWLTELGCPAVDKGANQPSVFPDSKSSAANRPYFSNGQRDDLIQRRYLEAVIGAFDPVYGASETLNPVSPVYGGRMIDVSGVHLWTWDARPYPVFPAAGDVWSDAPNWQTGHWLTGRLGGAPLDALIAALLDDSGITGIETGGLRDGCDGYVVDRPMTPRAMIEPLATAYAFDATPIGGQLSFISRGGAPVAEIAEDDLVMPDKGAPATLTRGQETELPREVSFGFTDGAADYRRSAVASRRLVGGANRTVHIDLAIVTSDAAATRRADIRLQDLWAGRETVSFGVGMERLRLSPGDVFGLTLSGRRRLFEVSELIDTEQRRITARSIDPDIFAVPLAQPRRIAPAIPPALGPVQALALDLPSVDASDPPVLTRIAVFADPWPGSVTIWRSADGLSFEKAAVALAPSVIGETLDPLPAGPSSRWDRGSRVRILLYGGALASLSEGNVLNGANVAAVLNADGDWEILQFASATLTGERTYELSHLLRGQAGSEYAIANPLPAGSPFVLLDDHVIPLARGLTALDRAIDLRIVASGHSHDDPSALALAVTPRKTALMPLSPVHAKASRDSDGIHLAWIRRTRREGDAWGVEVPLGEDAEAYEVDILDDGDVVRTLSSSSPSALYANADELADFGVAQTVLHIRVVQLSSTVGRGHPAEFTLTI